MRFTDRHIVEGSPVSDNPQEDAFWESVEREVSQPPARKEGETAMKIGDEVYVLAKVASPCEGDHFHWVHVADDAKNQKWVSRVPTGSCLPAAVVEDLAEAADHAQCACSVRDRDSGHRIGCWMPELIGALAAYREATKGAK